MSQEGVEGATVEAEGAVILPAHGHVPPQPHLPQQDQQDSISEQVGWVPLTFTVPLLTLHDT